MSEQAYAVIATGGKQHRVKVGQRLKVEKLPENAGDKITFDKVLLTSKSGEVKVGAPFVGGATVLAEVLNQGRGKKVMITKFKRRKKYRRLQGHRQSETELKILEIN